MTQTSREYYERVFKLKTDLELTIFLSTLRANFSKPPIVEEMEHLLEVELYRRQQENEKLN